MLCSPETGGENMSSQPTEDSQAHQLIPFAFVASDTSDEQYLAHFKIFLFHFGALAGGSVLMTFLVAPKSGGTFQDLRDDAGTVVSVTIAANTSVAVTDAVKALALAASGVVKLKLDASETATVQLEANR